MVGIAKEESWKNPLFNFLFTQWGLIPIDRGMVDREAYLKAGEQGYLLMWADEKYGGAGVADFRYEQVLIEENIRHGEPCEPKTVVRVHRELVGVEPAPGRRQLAIELLDRRVDAALRQIDESAEPVQTIGREADRARRRRATFSQAGVEHGGGLRAIASPGLVADDPFVDTLLKTLRSEHGLDDAGMALRLEQT